MYIGQFTAGQTKTLQIERKAQVLQFYAKGMAANKVADVLNSKVEVWNNKGKLIPPTMLKDLAVLNGDEYALQMGLHSASGLVGTFAFVVDVELCDEGSIEKTIYVKMTNLSATINVELSAVDVLGSTAVKLRNYNQMNIVSPCQLPKHSICILPLSGVTSIQKNNDLMSESEILTHSNRILTAGVLKDVHPIVADPLASTTIVENVVYTTIALSYAMGYGSQTSGYVVLWTGDDDFVLYPNTSCSVTYCEKQLTKIAEQVKTALAVAGQTNNVDSNEFAAAVAAVGNTAEQQGLSTDNTQFVANQVIGALPSVKIARLANVKNFNLASESAKLAGNSKIANI